MSALVNLLVALGCASPAESAGTSSARARFEVVVVGRDTERLSSADPTQINTADTFSVRLLSLVDLRRAEAVVTNKWFILSGRHSTSTLVLHLRPYAVSGFNRTVNIAIRHGATFAVRMNGQTVGTFVMMHELSGDCLAIDSGFLSRDPESERVSVTRALAKQINQLIR